MFVNVYRVKSVAYGVKFVKNKNSNEKQSERMIRFEYLQDIVSSVKVWILKKYENSLLEDKVSAKINNTSQKCLLM